MCGSRRLKPVRPSSFRPLSIVAMADKKTNMVPTTALEELCKSCHTPLLKCKCSRKHPPGLEQKAQGNGTTTTMAGNSSSSSTHHTAAATTPIRPQTVLDPLHTGLSQNVQTAEAESTAQPAIPPMASQPATDCNDAQQLSAGYVGDEMLRSSEIMTEAYATTSRKSPEVPT